MKITGNIFIDSDNIGTVDFTIIDESMGVIAGNLDPLQTYYRKYETVIQKHFNVKGIANEKDLNIIVKVGDSFILDASGGIGIIDAVEYDNVYIEVAGVDLSNLQFLASAQDGL